MALLQDLFGFFSVLLDGAVMLALAVTVGGVGFLLLAAQPLSGILGPAGRDIVGRVQQVLVRSALALAGTMVLSVLLHGSLLSATLNSGWDEVIGAQFFRSGLMVAASALLLAGAVASRIYAKRPLLLPLLVCLILVCAGLVTHAAARVENRVLLIALTLVHVVGASLWVGTMPYLMASLALCRDHIASQRVAARFFGLAVFSIVLLASSGFGLGWWYVEDLETLYGTAYGLMLAVKVLLFGSMLLMGLASALVAGHLRRVPHAPVVVLRRVAEGAFGLGVAVFLCGASLVSLPPGGDVRHDRLTLEAIAQRLTPQFPIRLTSPPYEALAVSQLQSRLDAEARAATAGTQPSRAYVPGGGVLPPRVDADMAWSEFNHHWAGIVVLLVGVLALGGWSGVAPMARHWPLLFLALAVFLFFRADPESWPMGPAGFWESWRDVDVARRHLLVMFLAVMAIGQWRVQVGRVPSERAAQVFPLLVAGAGMLLLCQVSSLANVREELLLELPRLPIAVLGVIAGWSRWLEVRLPAPYGRLPGLVWPVCFMLVGLILLNYRES